MTETPTPVRRGRPPREVHSSDFEVGQAPSVDLTADEIDTGNVIEPVDKPLANAYIDQLAFNEEPVTIRVDAAPERYAPKFIQCWVNGKGAEVLIDGKWVELGGFPVNIPAITKRKYVEVLARSKADVVDTVTGDVNDANPVNRVERSTYSKAPFSVIRDDNPRGHEWLRRIFAER